MGFGVQGFDQASMEPGDYEPVAATFWGLRVFYVDSLTRRFPTIEREYISSGGEKIGPSTRPGQMRSIHKGEYVWAPGKNTAVCLAGPAALHQAPAQECGCGFWAFTGTESRYTTHQSWFAAYGVIEGWGRMVAGPRGFRCQHAAIRAVALDDRPLPTSPRHPSAVAAQATAQATASRLARILRAWHARQDPAAAAELARMRAERDERKRRAELAEAAERRTVSAAIRLAYPDVVQFDQVEDMLAAFPLTDLSALLAAEAPEPPELSA